MLIVFFAVSWKTVGRVGYVEYSEELIDADKYIVLVDLDKDNDDSSAYAIYPHSKENYIRLISINIDFVADSGVEGILYLGFMSDVDTTTGTLNIVKQWNIDNIITADLATNQYYSNHINWDIPLDCTEEAVLGETITDTTSLINGATFYEINATAFTNIEDGDLVLFIDHVANSITMSIGIQYTTE